VQEKKKQRVVTNIKEYWYMIIILMERVRIWAMLLFCMFIFGFVDRYSISLFQLLNLDN